MKLSIREKLVEPYIVGKSVLDVGSVGQTTVYNFWDFLLARAGDLTGIDVVASHDPLIVEGNAEEYDFGKKFDVIFAGDVIQQMANPGRFLANAKKHLSPGGRLIITTANAKWWTIIFKPNPYHTLWHDRFTLRYLLETHKFIIERFSYYSGNKFYPWWLRLMLKKQAFFVVARVA